MAADGQSTVTASSQASTSGLGAGPVRAHASAPQARAARAASTTFALTGRSGNPLAARSDDALCVDSPHTATVQEVHQVAIHLVCSAVDREVALRAAAPHSAVTM